MELQVLHTDGRQCIGFWNNIAMIDVAGEMNLEGMTRVCDLYRSLARDYKRVACLTVVRSGAPVATMEAQQAGANVGRELGPTLAMISIVIEAQGVVGQLFRSAMRAFTVFARAPPISIAGTLDDGLPVLVPLVESSLPRHHIAYELSCAFKRMRSDYQPR
jgi:hypothetical protein